MKYFNEIAADLSVTSPRDHARLVMEEGTGNVFARLQTKVQMMVAEAPAAMSTLAKEALESALRGTWSRIQTDNDYSPEHAYLVLANNLNMVVRHHRKNLLNTQERTNERFAKMLALATLNAYHADNKAQLAKVKA